jgi:predicted RNase H-like HicB family nuclease
MPIIKVPLVLTPQPEGGYTVTSPVLPELVTEGDTVEEALENVRDVLKGGSGGIRRHRQTVPGEPPARCGALPDLVRVRRRRRMNYREIARKLTALVARSSLDEPVARTGNG